VSIAPLLPEQCILLKGFSKTFGMTGWRLGYAAGPKAIIDQMTKLQQYTFVCAPSMVQYAGVETLHSPGVDMSAHIENYRTKRDRTVEGLKDFFEINDPGRGVLRISEGAGERQGDRHRVRSQSDRAKRADYSGKRVFQPGYAFSDQLRNIR
jgi:aspartate/methionine/tyrosine aminotransferase